MSKNNTTGGFKNFFYKLAIIVALAVVIFILIFVIANFNVVLIYIRTSETLRDLIAILLDAFF